MVDGRASGWSPPQLSVMQRDASLRHKRDLAPAPISPSRSRCPAKHRMVDGARMVAIDVAIAHRSPGDVAGWLMVANRRVVGATRA